MSRGLESSSAAIKALLPLSPAPQPCSQDLKRGKKLKLFVYGLAWGYAGQIVEYVEGRARSLLRVRCSYLREDTCPNTGFSHLENLRSHCTDVPIMYKLLQSATIEPDPSKADVFLVPFLMGCNAMLGWGHGMQRVNAREHHAFFGDFKTFARKQLPHFAKWPHRHLFLFPLDSMFAPRWLLPSMVAHTGSGYTTAGLDVTVPYLVSLPPQPKNADLAPRKRFVFLMASPSRNLVRTELAAQLRIATTRMRSDASAPKVELYETDPSKENAMPLSASETMARMRDTTFCVAPTGDSDGFTQRFYYILAAGCIPVRVDTYYSNYSFGRVAWPFKQTIQWRKAAILLPPHKLRRDGLIPTLLNISQTRIASMQRYIREVARPHTLFDYRGRHPDAFSAFLDELIHLSKTRLPKYDRQRVNGGAVGKGKGGGKRRAAAGDRPPMCEAVPHWLPGHQKNGVLGGLCKK